MIPGGHDEPRVRLEMYESVPPRTDATDEGYRYRDLVKEQTAGQRLSAWYRGLNPFVVDAVLTAVLVVLGFVSTSGRGTIAKADFRARDALNVILILAATLPFLVRRRAPLLVLVVTATAVVLISGRGYNEGLTPLFVMLAAGSLAANSTSVQTGIGATVVFAELVALYFFSEANFTAANLAANLAFFTAVFMIGVTIKSRRQRVEALEQRALAVEREQEEESRRAVADERLRIARELHDVVAHSMGVIAVQAGVGEHVIDTDPAEAKRALQAISDVSRSTLAEIRRMLGVLREGEDGAANYSPAPGLDELDRLTRELDGVGLPVDVSFEGTRVELPRGVDLTAYRIVQEALTNVLKHAGPARASVLVRYEPGEVRVEITDDGRGVNGRSNGGGHGLVGMRERVAVYGGTLETGPRVGGGFRVAASLPYEDSA